MTKQGRESVSYNDRESRKEMSNLMQWKQGVNFVIQRNDKKIEKINNHLQKKEGKLNTMKQNT